MNTKTKSGRNTFKEFAPALIISFSLCYMLFFFEPLNTFASNALDFSFDFKLYIFPTLGMFGMFFIGLLTVFLVVYFICRRLGKMLAFKILTAVTIFLLFPLYVQNTFLNYLLPILNGSPIEWNERIYMDVFWLMFTICFGIIYYFCIQKFGIDKILKTFSLVSLAIVAMLTAGLISTIISRSSTVEENNNFISTTRNFNTLSSEKNFIIIVADSISATEFNKILSESPKYAEVFEDFTYYSDTMSVYTLTHNSIPLILTGEVYKHELPYGQFCTNAYNNSPLFSALEERNYDINLYVQSNIFWAGERNFDIKNSESCYDSEMKLDIDSMCRYIFFKFAPYTLKRFSDIENTKAFSNMGIDAYDWDNHSFITMIRENPQIEKQERNVFQAIHTMGAHHPFNYDENVNLSVGSTYNDMIKASITTVKAYIDRLKANGLYDNTAIIVMADHGYTDYYSDYRDVYYEITRLNPILLIKGINEHHEFIKNDDIPVIQTDLLDAYMELLDGKKSTELFANIKNPRTRTAFTQGSNFLSEYETDGKAAEYDKFKLTGKTYP